MFPNPTRPSTLKHDFSMVPKADIPRSSFDRSHGYKTAFDSAKLIPVFADEVLPGDSFNLHMNAFARLSTPIVPFMDNLRLNSFFFFVPLRLIWANFKKFMGEQANPADSVSYTVPVFTAYTPAAESLSDYLGVPIAGATTPIGAAGTVSHISLFHRAYNLIWNDWFRDENLQNSVTVDTGDGPDAIASYVLLKRGKRHDYFTSALPWTQKGTAVTLPLSGSANVKGIGVRTHTFGDNLGIGNPVTVYEAGGGTADYWPNKYKSFDSSAANTTVLLNQDGSTGYPQIYADLSTATASTINALRLAFQTQIMLERDARGGTRYTEIVRSHFGVISPDARLQRSEYLGGGSTPIVIQPVAATAFTSGSNALGRLAAVGTAMTRGDGFVKSFTEHGVILGMVCVTADLTYQGGLQRMFSRSTRLDFYFPALAHLGEQAILNKEIYMQGSANPTQDAAAFGYQERFAEYRYKPSLITGKMRSQYATPLDVWHLAQKFTALPVLDTTFITEAPPIDRVVAVNTEPQFFGDFYFDFKCARPMPVYSVPGLIDHF